MSADNNERSCDIALVSVSIDLGAGRRGVDMGPSALRIAGLSAAIEQLGYTIRERGTVTARGQESVDIGNSSAQYLEEVSSVCEQARAEVLRGLEEGYFPVILGGDHSISIGTVRAVADHVRMTQQQSIGLIWVDAHTDMNTPHTSPSGNIHGMPMAVLTGQDVGPLSALTGSEPSVKPENVSMIGVREVDRKERELVRDAGIRVFTMKEMDERGVARCMDEAIERASTGTAGFHLSYDLDSVDPMVAPGVGTPVPGGLTYREAHLISEKAAQSGSLLSFELVELNPVRDDRNRTAEIGVGLIASALGKTIL